MLKLCHATLLIPHAALLSYNDSVVKRYCDGVMIQFHRFITERCKIDFYDALDI